MIAKVLYLFDNVLSMIAGDKSNESPGTVSSLPESNRLLGLDILRFVAICLVILHHAPAFTSQGTFERILQIGARGGWTGVDLFFVLSGFLVSGLLFKEYKRTGTVRLIRFLLRRGWRIYPPFWAMILFSILLVDCGLWDQFYLHSFAGEILFLQNYLGGMWGPTWSLAVEEHFYFFLAGVIFLMLQLNQTQKGLAFANVPALFLWVAFICLSARVVAGFLLHQNPVTIVHQSQYRMDSLMFGVLISWWWSFKTEYSLREWLRLRSGTLIGIGTLCFIPAFVWDSHAVVCLPVLGVISFYIGGGLLVVGMISQNHFAPPLKWLATLGAYSYSVYLWNGIVYELLLPALMQAGMVKWGPGLTFATYFALSWIVGIATAKVVEIPSLKWRDRLLPV